MAVVSLSKIQIRRGRKNSETGVPQLASGELAWAIDTQELFIGNGAVSEGAPAVGNTKILTEHDVLNSISGQLTYNYINTNTTLEVNTPYLVDASAGGFIVGLPIDPEQGEYVILADGANWYTNNVTVDRNGKTVEGGTNDVVLDIGGSIVTFIYDGTTWQVLTTAGPRGYSGYSGRVGTSGYSGARGVSGYSGAAAASGFSGYSGQNGTIGTNGASGFSGYSGVGGPGASGFSGYSGAAGAASASGFSGYSGAAGTGAVGKQTIWVPSVAMSARITGGAALNYVETAVNKNLIATFDFDNNVQEFVQFEVKMPKSWDEGTVTFAPVWSHSTSAFSFGVVWGVDAVAISDNESIDAAVGTEQTSTDVGGTGNKIYIGPESAPITIAGSPSAEDYVIFRVHRNVDDIADDLDVDARLHGITIYYTSDSSNDA